MGSEHLFELAVGGVAGLALVLTACFEFLACSGVVAVVQHAA